MKTKFISWSYPTSPNAARFGFDRSGCWTVQTIEYVDGVPLAPEPVFGSNDFQAAIEHAKSIAGNWDKLNTHNPEPDMDKGAC